MSTYNVCKEKHDKVSQFFSLFRIWFFTLYNMCAKHNNKLAEFAITLDPDEMALILMSAFLML